MILIDSLYINNGGGKILLDYLVSKLYDRDDIFYLFDERCKGEYDFIPSQNRTYLSATLISRHTFYERNKAQFTKVLCFGNLSPTIHLDAEVYTYFHQRLFLSVPSHYNMRSKILLKVKSFIFGLLLSNTDFVLVQSSNMAKASEQKYKIVRGKMMVLPFYPNEDLTDYEQHKKGRFIYVSSGAPYKNHITLINAFCKYHDNHREGELILTINYGSNLDLESLIKKKKDQGYPIENLGFIDRNRLIQEYNKAEYLVFPSLEESFGLGLVEAIECGCKVIGADRPYTYQVCEPSITFNPLDSMDLLRALEESREHVVKPTKQIIKNEIDALLGLLR